MTHEALKAEIRNCPQLMKLKCLLFIIDLLDLNYP